MSRLDYFKARTVFLSWRLRVDFTVASSTDIVLLEFGERILGLFGGNFGFMLSTDFLPLFFPA